MWLEMLLHVILSHLTDSSEITVPHEQQTKVQSIRSFLFLYHLLFEKDQIVVVKDQICVALLVCPVLCGSQSAEAEQVRLQDHVSCA